MKKVVNVNELQKILKRQPKNKVVFTNGCFDILHAGHVRYLNAAKAKGDVLIVGLNSDQSAKKLKGKNRPINSQKDRAEVLAALKSVNYVVIFNESTPYRLIKAIRPHVLVKGGDWSKGKIVGRDIVESYGGKVSTIPFVKNRSTSNIIKKIIQQS